MNRSLFLAPLLFLLPLAACEKEDFATKMCLSDDGTSQDCGIGCKVSKNDKACTKWADMTKKLCDELGKEKCQEICEADENPAACEIAKSM